MLNSEIAQPDRLPEHMRMEDLLKQRPTRASSTTSQFTPQLVLMEAEHQSESDQLSEGSEEGIFSPETIKAGAERLAERRSTRRFRSARATP